MPKSRATMETMPKELEAQNSAVRSSLRGHSPFTEREVEAQTEKWAPCIQNF